MLKDALTEAELQALLGDEALPQPAQGDELVEESQAALADGDRRLLHALVRNQLRLMHRIEELHTELLRLKSADMEKRTTFETATGLEPLPFLKLPSERGDGAGQQQASAPVPEVSRKERFKRQSRW